MAKLKKYLQSNVKASFANVSKMINRNAGHETMNFLNVNAMFWKNWTATRCKVRFKQR